MTSLRRRRAATVAGGLVLLAAVTYGATRLGDAPADEPRSRGGTSGSAEPAELLVLQVTGTEDPLIALIGTRHGDRPPAYFTLPFDLTLTVPGQGEATVREVAGMGGATMGVAVSNTFGVWAEHVAVVDLEGLAAAVDRAGGVRVQVPGFYATEAGDIGPGASELSGPQVTALLSVQDGGGEARWAALVQGLLRDPVRLTPDDLVDGSGVEGVRRLLTAARGAGLALFPTVTVAGSVTVPLQPDLDHQVSRTFGSELPVPVIVENGVGAPGLGEDVAVLLLPAGYRVVVSQNAEPFGYERTRVVANGGAALEDARRVREALGVGRVGVSQVPSGIGDITIIVGEDFTG